MTTTAIRKKLTDYIQTAPDKKVKALYTFLENQIEGHARDFDGDTSEELKQAATSTVKNKKK